jgi:hypothetical protein
MTNAGKVHKTEGNMYKRIWWEICILYLDSVFYIARKLHERDKHFHSQQFCCWLTCQPSRFSQYASGFWYFTARECLGSDVCVPMEYLKAVTCTIYLQRKN